jgi:hypothetical protein
LRGVSTFSDRLIVLAIFLLLDFLTLLARVVGVGGDGLSDESHQHFRECQVLWITDRRADMQYRRE